MFRLTKWQWCKSGEQCALARCSGSHSLPRPIHKISIGSVTSGNKFAYSIDSRQDGPNETAYGGTSFKILLISVSGK